MLYIFFKSKRGAASSRKQFSWKIPVLQRKRSRVVFPPSLKVTGLVTQVFFLSMKATSVSTSCFVFWYLLSDQISRSVLSDSLWPHESQHARPPCPSSTPRVHSNSRPLSQWCYPAISSSVVPFSSCPQSLPASESFPVSQLFAWGDQSIGVSASASVLPMNTQDWSPLGWTGWISLQSKGLSRVLSNTHSSKASILWWSAFFIVQLSHPYMTNGKTIALTRYLDLCWQSNVSAF